MTHPVASFERLTQISESYAENVVAWPVIEDDSAASIREYLCSFDFAKPQPLDALTDNMAQGLKRWTLHTSHPRYFGLFNPAPSAASVVADGLVALFNPQLAVWAHAPFANEVETHVLRFFARHLDYPESASAQFTSGGSEANHSAVLTALAHYFPAYLRHGLAGIPAKPVLYISREGHHSFDKIIKNVGLGLDSLRKISVDTHQQLDVEGLRQQIQKDRDDGYTPFLIIGTAGTTGTGAIDPLNALRSVANQTGMWLHVDAAWAGTAVLVPSVKETLSGIETADSITIDAHKWLSVSMGAGMFFCRHSSAVRQAFGLLADYMPSQASTEPYLNGLQWSRRFIGLKAFMTLANLGEEGVRRQMERQLELSARLRQELLKNGWQILTHSSVGVVCFTHHQLANQSALTDRLHALMLQEGQFWLSTYPVGDIKAFRACVTSTNTQEADVDALIVFLNDALPLIRNNL